MLNQKTIKKIGLLLILLWGWGALIYSNSLHGAFVFDDISGIVENPNIRNFHQLNSMWAEASLKPQPCRRYITFVTFTLNYYLGGYDVFGYHLVNVFIHLTNATLVWWLAFLLLSSPVMQNTSISKNKEYLAFGAGLLFMAHPLQTQAVSYVYQRLAALAAFFYLLSLGAYAKARILDFKQKTSMRFYLLSGIAACLGWFTKENTYTLPFAIGLIEFFFFSREGLRKIWQDRQKRHLIFLAILVLIFLISFFSLDVTRILKTRVSLAKSREHISSIHYFLTQSRVIMRYIRLLFLPVGQIFDYDFPVYRSFFHGSVMLSFLAIGSLITFAVKMFRSHRLISFGIFFFFLALSIEASIIPIRHVIFEHRVYLPMVGFIFFCCGGLHALKLKSRGIIIVITTVAMVFSFLTYQRNKIWQNNIVFWKDAVKKAPHKARPYDNLGAAYLAKQRYEEAIINFQKAISLDPENYHSYNNLAQVFDLKGDFDAAVQYYHLALERKPGEPKVLNNLGVLFGKNNDVEQAKSYFRQARVSQKHYVAPSLNLASLYRREENTKEVISICEEVLENWSHGNDCHYFLVEAYLNEKEKHKAIDIGKKMLGRVENSEILTSAGSLFAGKGLVDMAFDLFRKVLKKDPRYKNLYLELGKLFGNIGDFDRAIGLWEEGLRYHPDEERFKILIQEATRLKENQTKRNLTPKQ